MWEEVRVCQELCVCVCVERGAARAQGGKHSAAERDDPQSFSISRHTPRRRPLHV